jgi:hypothetical protein
VAETLVLATAALGTGAAHLLALPEPGALVS